MRYRKLRATIPLISTHRSYTALSCAMSWVIACELLISHNVAVVSMEQVTIFSGRVGFHEKDVMGGRLVCGDLLYPSTSSPRGDRELTFVRTLRVFRMCCGPPRAPPT